MIEGLLGTIRVKRGAARMPSSVALGLRLVCSPAEETLRLWISWRKMQNKRKTARPFCKRASLYGTPSIFMPRQSENIALPVAAFIHF